MQFSVALVALFASAAIAVPTGNDVYDPCTGSYKNAKCCATDVLGVADLDCQTPPSVPTSASNFQAICAKGGQRARCCGIPILGQALLCDTPIGVVY